MLNAADAAHAAAQLDAYKAALPKRVRATRAELEPHPDAPLLEFDTAAELLYRFIDDLHAYAATYASLAVDTHEREHWIERYVPKTNAHRGGRIRRARRHRDDGARRVLDRDRVAERLGR